MEKEYTKTQFDDGLNIVLDTIHRGAVNGENLENIMRTLKAGVVDGPFIDYYLYYLSVEGLVLKHEAKGRYTLTDKGLDYIRHGGYIAYKKWQYEKAYNDLHITRFAIRTQVIVFIIAILALIIAGLDLLTKPSDNSIKEKGSSHHCYCRYY